jgi:sugar phosphate permease
LPSANSLTSFSMQMGRIVGPALGAGLVSLGGTPIAFALNGLTFFISAAFLAPLAGLPTPPREQSESTSVIRDAREGIAVVLRTPWLWISIAVFALSNVTLAGPYSVAMPFLVKDHLQIDVGALGALYAIFPIGYVIGGVWLGRKSNIRKRGLLMYGGLMAAGLMLALFGLPVPDALGVTLWVVALGIAALINGAALEAGNLAWTNALQEFVPSDKLGRVSSIDMLGSFVLLPIGFGLTGWATEQLGPAPVFVIGGGLTAILALLAFAHPKVRHLD